jgi:SSS family solute:Na+ symporter
MEKYSHKLLDSFKGALMNGYSIFLVLLAAYIATLMAIGWYFNNRQKSITDFWLAGRRIGPVALGISAAASWITAGGILAVIALYMLFGIGSIWEFVAPNILALLILAILVKKIKNLPAITQPELLEQRYSGAIRAPVALIITVVMILFAVADIKGFALVLQEFYGLTPFYAAAIVAIAVSVYVTLGGLSAVVWTDVIQFLFLAVFTIAMAFATIGTATTMNGATDLTVSELLGGVSGDWWNPFSIGIPMILIFSFAILPGWISEQDPWQKVWAAKDEKSAQVGMIIGSLMITVVFGSCIAIAIALNYIYPQVAAAVDYPSAESSLLTYIFTYFGNSSLIIALCSIGLAAAAMSCTDTFSTSGGSCISRDLFQRYIKPDATMKEMLIVNRISVLIIIFAATVLSFKIEGIIDAIHIATYIASASYFFPLMGGLYWKRATKEGAFSAMVVGLVSQVGLVVLQALRPEVFTALAGTLTAIGIPPEIAEGLFSNYGVIVGMLLSAVVFFGVSLMTKPSSRVNLAPFFAEEAEELAHYETRVIDEADPSYNAFLKNVDEKVAGERAHLQLTLRTSGALSWNELIEKLKTVSPAWVTPTGIDSVYRLTHGDMLSCVAVTRGSEEKDIWLKAEPKLETVGKQKKELFTAYEELKKVLEQKGIKLAFTN